MAVSISSSVVEKFNFNGQNVRSLYIKDIGECLLAKDVYKAVGYEQENGKKAIQNLVPDGYKLRYGDVKFSVNKRDEIKPLHPDTVLLKESGLYCFLLRCKKDKAQPFMKWVVETVLPREVRRLNEQLENAEASIALLSDDLEVANNRCRQLEFNSVGLQGEIRAKNQQIAQLQERYVDYANDPGLDNVVMIVRKHTTEAEDRHFFNFPYYIARIQRRNLATKRRCILKKFPNSEEIVVINNPNSIHAFNRLEEQGHINRYKCHFRLVDLTREDLYDMGIPPPIEA